MKDNTIQSTLIGSKVQVLSCLSKRLCFFILSITLILINTYSLKGQEKLLKFSIVGGTNIHKNILTTTYGGLVSIKIKEQLRVETGYIRDKFVEQNITELLTIRNEAYYGSVPLHVSYSLGNFDFVAGPSFHFLNNGLLSLKKQSDSYEGTYTYTYDERETTENYQGLFGSFDLGVRYYIRPYWGLAGYYSCGITKRYKNPQYDTPFHAVKLNLFVRFSFDDLFY